MNYHQGDIILKRINAIPKDAKKIRDEIIAFGEVTGHSHRIIGAEIFGVDEKEFVRIKEAHPMIHNEHPPTENVEIGDYERLRQFEYFPEGDIEVKD